MSKGNRLEDHVKSDPSGNHLISEGYLARASYAGVETNDHEQKVERWIGQT